MSDEFGPRIHDLPIGIDAVGERRESDSMGARRQHAPTNSGIARLRGTGKIIPGYS